MRKGRNMAEIVAAFGVPHTPNFPALVAKQGPDCRTAQLYAQVAALLHGASPDVLVVPNDQTAMPSYRVAGEASLASHVHAGVIAAGFDLSLVQDFDLDHSIMVPLHFLTPDMAIPIVPVFINGLAPPLPSAQRCSALGHAVKDAIEDWPANKRVAVIGSVIFLLEIGAPRIPLGEGACTPDPQWAMRVQD